MKSPKLVCQAEDSAYFGYGETEVHSCTRAATHKAADDFVPYWVKSVQPKVLLCEWHAQTPGAKAYRFRTLAVSK